MRREKKVRRMWLVGTRSMAMKIKKLEYLETNKYRQHLGEKQGQTRVTNRDNKNGKHKIEILKEDRVETDMEDNKLGTDMEDNQRHTRGVQYGDTGEGEETKQEHARG